MPEVGTTAAVESTPVAAEAKAKKAKKTPAAKKPAKAATKAKSKAPAKAKKDGLRKPQIAVLTALSKNSRALSRNQISEKAGVDLAGLTEWIGSEDEGRRLANDKKHFPSLISLRHVKHGPSEDGGSGATYIITESGRKALEKSKAE